MALRVLGFLCLAVVILQIIASIASDGPANLGGDRAAAAGFCFWISSVWLDYTALAAFHAERSADSLLRMEWAARGAKNSQREQEGA